MTDNNSSDAGLISFLQGQGHTVSGGNQEYTTLDASKIATLNAADLVIVSRNTNSGDYANNATEIAQWDAIATPLLLGNAYLARNNRWGWMTNDTLNLGYELDITPPDMTAGSHPVYAGVVGQAGGVFYSGALKYDPTASSGIDIMGSANDIAGDGVALAVRNNSGTTVTGTPPDEVTSFNNWLAM
ncbi:MAG: hypothetical protein ACQKBY_11875, partial [Verrucomicrobiales bacterium]